MYHFFVDPGQIGPTDIAITGSDVNHIRNVLRMQPGEQITVSSGEDEKAVSYTHLDVYKRQGYKGPKVFCTL